MPNSSAYSSPDLYLPDAVAAARPEMAGATSEAVEKAVGAIEDYARREPLKFAACVFGIGFVLGWRLKPW